MFGKIFGGVLLIVGTSVGGAILALPMVTAQAGFLPSIALLLLIWFLMTVAALCVLEVSLSLPPGTNLISMSKKSLGKTGEWLTWLTYLMLLYALIAAFMAGGADVVKNLMMHSGINLSMPLNALLFLLPIVPLVGRGIQSVDWANRALMSFKLVTLVLLVGLLGTHVSWPNLSVAEPSALKTALAPVITAFGYAIITPSLREYIDDPVILKRMVLVGSLIPLACYIGWLFAIQGALGQEVLFTVSHSQHAVSDLIDALEQTLNSPIIALFARLFISVSVITTFLGITLSLRDFLFDGLKLKQNVKGHSVSLLLTFVPPFIILLFKPDLFIAALAYAGLMCVVLLMLIPFAMTYASRYLKVQDSPSLKVMPFGQKTLLACLVLGSILLLLSIWVK